MAHERVRELVDRGRADGSFRTDLPAGWLVASCLALIHAGAEEVRAGRIDPDGAFAVLMTTVRDLFTAPAPVHGARARLSGERHRPRGLVSLSVVIRWSGPTNQPRS